jgi:Putative heavy-metal-binding
MTGSRVRALAMSLTALCVVACATSQSGFRPLGSATYAARPADSAIEVFEGQAPERAFDRIARLDAHYEKTHFISTSRETAIAELKKQARAAGADAIVDIEEKRSQVGETLILHVTATAIRYREL